MTELSKEELERYSRHLVMPEVSLAGQQNLKNARVLCVGAGGLGSPLALYLAAAGIGTLGLVEFDTVDLSNIQRQVLYATADVGRPKLDAACERLRQLNPHIELMPHALRLDADNVMAIIRGYDIVVDGSDNFATRYLVNDAAVLAGIPNVHASVYRFEGQLSVFDAARGPCYNCLFPEPPPAGLVPSCAEGGVLGMLPGILGSMQALEVVKLILDCGEPLIGRLLTFDGLRGAFRELRVHKDKDCAVCGVASTLRAPRADIAGALDACAVTDAEDRIPTVSAEELAGTLQSGQPVVLIDVREPGEVAIARIAGATLLPLGELPARLAEFDAALEYVVTCHKGGRARRAGALMREAGFEHVRILDGGIDAWAARIDPSMLRY
jgi:molybdopterin/thiamine biosynthesis adenylyltransferase/rhodanese-related sulfurtransferase